MATRTPKKPATIPGKAVGNTWDWTDDFDKKIEILEKVVGKPPRVTDAAVYVRDTLHVAWLAAQSVFGDKATPETALAIYEMMNEERLRLVHGESED